MKNGKRQYRAPGGSAAAALERRSAIRPLQVLVVLAAVAALLVAVRVPAANAISETGYCGVLVNPNSDCVTASTNGAINQATWINSSTNPQEEFYNVGWYPGTGNVAVCQHLYELWATLQANCGSGYAASSGSYCNSGMNIISNHVGNGSAVKHTIDGTVNFCV